jgi:hypothetical protein
MIKRTTLGFTALLLLGIGAISPVAHANNVDISACPATAGISGDTYTLTANLTSTGTCVTITASDIAIDLHGHIITGDGTGDGITDTGGPLQNIIIANGTIKGFNEGIALFDTAYVTISKINATQSLNLGIGLGSSSTVNNSQANNNGSLGMLFGQLDGTGYDTVTNSQANNNHGVGMGFNGTNNAVNNSQANNNLADGMIFAGIGSPNIGNDTVNNSQANNNGGDGIELAGSGNTIISGTANNNVFNGIENGFAGGNTIISSPTDGNKVDGIHIVGDGNLLTADTADGNHNTGITLGCPSNLFGNTAHGNTAGSTSPSGLPGCTLLDNNF